jgi:uncharacterized membrane protein YbaN (DUF454 family)
MQRILLGSLRIVLGGFFLILAVAGFFLPILQGWLFLAVAILLLSPNVPLFARLIAWLEERSPRLQKALHAVRDKLDRWFPS